MPIPLGPISQDDPALAVYRNLPKRSSRFALLVAKTLGKKVVSVDSGVRVIMYFWRGHGYLSSVEYLGRSV